MKLPCHFTIMHAHVTMTRILPSGLEKHMPIGACVIDSPHITVQYMLFRLICNLSGDAWRGCGRLRMPVWQEQGVEGAEVLIAYQSQGEPELKIYDWARQKAKRWQVSVPYADL